MASTPQFMLACLFGLQTFVVLGGHYGKMEAVQVNADGAVDKSQTGPIVRKRGMKLDSAAQTDAIALPNFQEIQAADLQAQLRAALLRAETAEVGRDEAVAELQAIKGGGTAEAREEAVVEQKTVASQTKSENGLAQGSSLWPQVGAAHSKCATGNYEVSSQAKCQSDAVAAGKMAYQYRENPRKCFLCDSPEATNTDTNSPWQIYANVRSSCNSAYFSDKTFLQFHKGEYSKVGGGHNYCWVNGVKLSATEAASASWCKSYTQDQCKAWCEQEVCPGVLWRNSGNTCYLKKPGSDVILQEKPNGWDHHVNVCVTIAK